MAHKRLKLDATVAGARAFRAAVFEHGQIAWDGSEWTKIDGGAPAPGTVVGTRTYELAYLPSVRLDADGRLVQTGEVDPPELEAVKVGTVQYETGFRTYSTLLWLGTEAQKQGAHNTSADSSYGLGSLAIEAGTTDEEEIAGLLEHLQKCQTVLDTLPWPGLQPPRTRIPPHLSQSTAPEIHLVGRSSADGPEGRHWEEGEEGMYYVVEGASHEIKYSPALMSQWLATEATSESMWANIRAGGVDAALMDNIVAGLVCENDRVHLEIDSLINALGWKPRKGEREEKRRIIWLWLTMLAAKIVVGGRPGQKYTDADGAVIDTYSRDPLIAIVGTEWPAEHEQDRSLPPVRVSLVAGETLHRFRAGGRKALPFLGNLRAIGELPSGQPSGVWARAMGLSLVYLFRTAAAKKMEIHTPGEDNHLSLVRTRPFTRREIFDTYSPSNPSVTEILSSSNPARAMNYSRDAFQLLKEIGLISFCAPLKPWTPPRKGWREPWLDEELDIRPGPELTPTIAAIAERAHRAREATKRKRSAKQQRQKATEQRQLKLAEQT